MVAIWLFGQTKLPVAIVATDSRGTPETNGRGTSSGPAPAVRGVLLATS